jgi:hypothetical protein
MVFINQRAVFQIPRSNGSNVSGKPRQFGVYVGQFDGYSARCNAVAQAGYEGFLIC